MGVEPRRSIMLTNYARHDVFSKGDIKTAKLASPYLDQKIEVTDKTVLEM